MKDAPHLREQTLQPFLAAVAPDTEFVGYIRRVIHGVVKTPVAEEREPELLAWANAIVVRARCLAFIGESNRIQARNFVIEERVVLFILVSRYSSTCVLEGEAKNGEPGMLTVRM